MNPSGGIETADVAVRVAWVCGAAVRRSVGPPAVTLVVAASRRRLYDIAALVAPSSVAPFRREVQDTGLISLPQQPVRLRVCLCCILRC